MSIFNEKQHPHMDNDVASDCEVQSRKKNTDWILVTKHISNDNMSNGCTTNTVIEIHVKVKGVNIFSPNPLNTVIVW